MKPSVYTDIICALLVLLFLYTALSKLSDFDSFRGMLERSPLIGRYSVIVVWVLPVSELIVTALLLVPGWKLAGLYASLALLLLFTGYLLYILLFQSQHLPCSCGGILRKMTWKQHVVFNLFFIALCIAGIKQREKIKNTTYPSRLTA